MTRDEAIKIQPPHTNRFNKAHDLKLCCASVMDRGGGWFPHQCAKKPKVFYDDLGYCGTHDPVTVKRKLDERNARWEAEWAEKRHKRDEAEKLAKFREACEAAVRAIAAGHNDPMSLCKEILRNG